MTSNKKRKIKRRAAAQTRNLEELLNKENEFGKPDLTAYLAVENIINQQTEFFISNTH